MQLKKLLQLLAIGSVGLLSTFDSRLAVAQNTPTPLVLTVDDSRVAPASATSTTSALIGQQAVAVLAAPPPPLNQPAAPVVRAAPAQGGRGLRIPAELPGASAEPLKLPAYNPNNPQIRMQTIEKLFPAMPQLPPALQPWPGPNGRPLRLGELENMALATSPVIQQAMSDIASLRGKAIQDGTHPNPVLGYEGDTVGSGGTANYQGAYVQQVIKTAGKLQLAQAAATMDVRNAELDFRKARISVITTVQQRYYAVLAAEEGVRATQALAAFTDEAYRVQTEQLRGGEAAAYEPMQLRVLAMQARGVHIQARNRYYAAWKQLAAAVNTPDMPPTQLAGSLDIAIPAIRFDVALSRALERHTDILAARNGELKTRLVLRLQEVIPIPDLNFYTTVQKDFTSQPRGTTFNLQAGLPVPFLDRNTGAIMQARGELAKAMQQATRMRNEITAQAADAFERYENNRQLLEMYRGQVLPDQARVYRGVYERHQQQPDRVSFGDVIVAQQTLATSITSYLATLSAQWLAVTDLSNIMQVEDIGELQQLGTFQPQVEVGPVAPAEPGLPAPPPPPAN